MPPTTRTRSAATGRRQTPTKTVAVPKQRLTAAPDTVDVEVPAVDGSVLHFTSHIDPEDNPYGEREVVFTFDDVEYTAPVRVPASWGLQYARLSFLQGNDFAIVWALDLAMGTAALDALVRVPDLSPAQLSMITDRITDKFLAATTDPKGTSENE